MAVVIGLRAKATAMAVPELQALGVLGRQQPAGRRDRGWSRPSTRRHSRRASDARADAATCGEVVAEAAVDPHCCSPRRKRSSSAASSSPDGSRPRLPVGRLLVQLALELADHGLVLVAVGDELFDLGEGLARRRRAGRCCRC